MNFNNLIVYDFETSSADAYRTQPVQLAAVAVDGRKMEIIPNSEFSSLISIYSPEEADKLGLDDLQDGAVKVHGKTREMLATAPSIQSVWSNFSDYVNTYSIKGGRWGSPIAAGFNIVNFDNVITNRICCDEPYKLGPADSKGASLFHPREFVDMLNLSFLFFENDKNIKSLSADNLIRGYMGYSKGQAHDALSDVIMTAEYMIRSIKWLREKVSKVAFAGCFK